MTKSIDGYPHPITGVYIHPLPHESSVSCILRIAWLNEIPVHIVRQLFRGKGRNCRDSLFDHGLVVKEVVSNNLGWNLPTSFEDLINNSFQLRDVFFSSSFRICPICMEYGYHSYWHQFILLKTCPIHGCEISNTCMNCGKLLPTIGFSSDLFRFPYICRGCGLPYSGGLLPNSPGEGVKEHGTEVAAKFMELTNWLTKFDCKSRPYINAISNYPVKFRFGLQRYKLEIALMDNPPPISFGVSNRSCVDVLNWKIKMIKTWSQKALTSKQPDFSRITSVLKVVLRRLSFVVFGTLDSPLQRRFHKIMRSACQFQIFGELSALQHAYVEFCNSFVIGLDCDNCHCYKNVYLSSLPDVDLPQWETRLPRVALRNIFFAIFVAYYHKWNKFLSIFPDTMICDWKRDRDLIGYQYSISADGVSTGYVAFPKMDNFPYKGISPWRIRSADV